MSRSLLALALVASLGLVAWPAAAQMHHQMDSGAKRDCDLCAPQLSADAGALWRSAAVLPASGSDETYQIGISHPLAPYKLHLGL